MSLSVPPRLSSSADDDLSVQYSDIVKINNQLAPGALDARDDAKASKLTQLLHLRIQALFRNAGSRSKNNTNSGRSLKGIADRLTGKLGQLRNNLMG